MKLLYISGVADYSFLEFKENYDDMIEDIFETAYNCVDNKMIIVNDNCSVDIKVKAYKFGEVDPDFIQFIEREINPGENIHSGYIVLD